MSPFDSAPPVQEDLLPSTPPLDEESPFATMMNLFDEAAALLGVHPDEYAVLRKPDRQISVAVPVALDDGNFAVFDGFRVQHNQGLGPFTGPLRLDNNTSLDMLRALAGWLTWKCALLNIPFGGAAGCLRIDTKVRTRGEVERAVRRYTAAMLDVIGPDRDIISPDVGADAEVMAWIMDTVSGHQRHAQPAAVMGKPYELGGVHCSEDAVARGLSVICKLSLKHYSLQFAHTTVNIQGAGRVGGNLARMLHNEGYRVTGLSDLAGACYNEKGLDIPTLLAWRAQNRTLKGAPGNYERITNDELIAASVDIFVPCAVANAVHSRNARTLNCKLVIEGAHGPVSVRADRILTSRGIHVVPDILANAGGVVSDYFEWVQNRQGLTWLDAVVEKRLTRFMTEAWHGVVHQQETHGVRMRMAANMLAVERVAEADGLRGIYA